jgi:RNA polymerase sigma-70 factor (ECF subfamily)
MTKAEGTDQSPLVVSQAAHHGASDWAGGDFKRLFAMHAGYVWSALRRLGIPPSDLEDLTHDVFLQVHRHLGDFDATRPVRPWLFGFAFRLASQHRRRAHRRYEFAGDTDAAVHPGALPDQELGSADDRRLVLEALEAVDMQRRAVFILHDIDGHEMATVAQTLGIPVNTAYSRLRVARAEFAAAVKRLRPRRGPS